MKAERENDLVDLLDKLLNRGLVLNADLIISVAGIPLIGVSLKAAIAGIETMLEYGMMEAWDQRTREWYAREYAKKGDVPLREGEEVFLRSFGSFLDRRWINPTWRPGFLYLTNKRLLLLRREPPEVLLEIPLDKMEGLAVNKEMRYAREREELYIQFNCGEIVRIHAPNVLELKDEIEKLVGKSLEHNIENCHPPLSEDEKLLRVEKLWYLFPAMGILGETWKPGRLYLTNKRLFWVYRVDGEKMFEVPLYSISNLATSFDERKGKVLTITFDGRNASFSGDEQSVDSIIRAIEQVAHTACSYNPQQPK
ncbi:MAG: hypothetical protein HA494_06060 [Thaumarchaeota archaeon]|nr:hypothetical protein [Nitrososphaerota archaeon]